MSGLHLRIAGVQFKPWSTLVFNNRTQRWEMGGYCGEVLQYLQAAMNFSYTVVPTPGDYSGNIQPDGMYNGMMGMLQKNLSDVGIGHLSITYPRYQVVTFGPSYVFNQISVIAATKTLHSPSLVNLILTFDYLIWVVVAISLFVLVILSSAVEVLQDSRDWKFCLSRNFWDYFRLLFAEAAPTLPERGPLRLLMASWLTAVIVLTCGFGGNLRSALTAVPPPRHLDTVEDLVAERGLRVISIAQSSILEWMKGSPNPEIITLYQRVLDSNGQAELRVAFSDPTFGDIEEGRAVLIAEHYACMARVVHRCRTAPETRLASDSQFYFSRIRLLSLDFPVAYRKDLDDLLVRKINSIVRRITETGLIQKWMARLWYEWDACNDRAAAKDDQKPLSFDNMVGLFYLFLSCLAVSGVVLVLEIASARKGP